MDTNNMHMAKVNEHSVLIKLISLVISVSAEHVKHNTSDFVFASQAKYNYTASQIWARRT